MAAGMSETTAIALALLVGSSAWFIAAMNNSGTKWKCVVQTIAGCLFLSASAAAWLWDGFSTDLPWLFETLAELATSWVAWFSLMCLTLTLVLINRNLRGLIRFKTSTQRMSFVVVIGLVAGLIAWAVTRPEPSTTAQAATGQAVPTATTERPAAPTVQSAAIETPERIASRQAAYAFYDNFVRPSIQALDNFTTGRVLPNFPRRLMPMNVEIRRGVDPNIFANVAIGVNIRNAQKELQGIEAALQEGMNTQAPLEDLAVLFSNTICGYERLAFWSLYGSLMLPEYAPDGKLLFERHEDSLYRDWVIRHDSKLEAKIVELRKLEGLARIAPSNRGDCLGPELSARRFRLHDIPPTRAPTPAPRTTQ
jgi:hypothetical protein